MCAVLACARPAAAADKVDVITFKNGDRITCEIKKLDRGTLEISTDPLGTVKVHWGEVAALASPREFEVQVSSGFQYYGALQAGAAGGEVMVAGGGAEIALTLADVIRLTPIGSTFWTRIDGSADAGFSFAQANTETHLTANASTNYRGPRSLFMWNYASQHHDPRRRRPDVPEQPQLQRQPHSSADRWYTHGWGVVEQNDELSLDLRLVGGGGFGRDIVHTNHRLWSIFPGLAYTHEQFSRRTVRPVRSRRRWAAAGLLYADERRLRHHQPDDLVLQAGRPGPRAPRLSEPYGRALQGLLLEPERLRHLDGDPPAEGKKNDFGVSFTLGYKF